MAETILSIVLEQLASVARQGIEQEVRLMVGVKKEVPYLTEVLQTIRAVVADAEKRQVTEERVKVWLERLKDMAYQMEDVVDEWSTAILKLQIERVENAAILKKVSSCGIIPSPFICFKQVASRRHIALKIKDIKERLDDIERERIRFNFVSSWSEERPQRLITTSAIDISEVYGRDMDKKAILDHLFGNKCQEKSGLYIVSIVGTGGMGKTTLAQLAYNHPKVKAHFDERIWVCVSDPFDPIRVCRAIVEALQKESCNLHDLEALQQKIQTCIAGKFFLVLDDVWTENHQLWEQLKNTLTSGAVGSRILVTTRKESVVKMMGTTYMHSLGELSREQCRALFHQIAFFEKRGWEKEEELKEIGENIADKCKGLPLAIKTLGNLLRLKNSKEEWKNVLNSEVWQLDEFERDISPALLLSYYDLPPAIKRCFSFCAVFPKDSFIETDKLIKLWMAQSYLNSDVSKEMETVGRKYFEYLAARSFFQDFEKADDGNIIGCKMHDIVHDSAQFLTQNECIIVEVDNQQMESIDLSFKKIRHTTLVVRESTPNFISTYNMKNLHTLLFEEAFNSRGLEALPNLLGHLTCLRALDLSSTELIEELPKEVGKLIHLRYLNLYSGESLRELPETICDLYNLQTLNIQACFSLQKLPQAMGKLINLRHLENYAIHNLEGLPKGIGRLSSLQTLDVFNVSSVGDDECKIGDLRNLNNLRGSLQIKGLDEVKDVGEAEKAELKNKIHLQHLDLGFGTKEGTKGVAEALRPHPNLKSLHIDNYGDREWPNWMMGSSLAQLKVLYLEFCLRCPCLPPLGQLPVLEKLHISDTHGVKYIGSEFLGSSSTVFPKLKELIIFNLGELKQWEIKEKEERSIMPCLNYLVMNYCPKLEGLPDHVLQRTTMQKLVIESSPILEQRYRKDIGEDRHKISHIPQVEY
ncbi:hypothetical protein PVL29_011726 [Vitis rotundifolia]|uniref:Disease resistance protein RGA3 n=1 Tax=Vitis rotundifolia TaxID=103349 RepID=A0AA38ZP97_VITRO|nr:hypothetical protein PVL29_011726 [Vitis rotundifolia]